MKLLTKKFFSVFSIILFSLLIISSAFAGILPTGFTETNVVTGLTSPIGMAFLPDGRILVIEQAGRVRLVVNGVLRTAPMLDITADVLDGGEQGLLGLAIDPDYPTRPYVYLYYNNTSPNLQYVVRYTATGTLNSSSSTDLNLDAASRIYLLNDIPNNATNHNGGTLRFGTDKRLYISMGDDAASCDAQNRTLLKGAIFRIKVDDTIVINSNVADKASLAPSNNTWFSSTNLNERLVFAYGLRNPFRFNVHPDTGNLFIGDVGSGTREEVDISTGGENFGWPYYEGSGATGTTNCGGQNSTMPIYDYTRVNTSASVIGGVVYKGVSFPNDASLPSEFNGNFFFNDYYSGNLRVLRWNGSSWNLVAGVDSNNFGTGYNYVSDWTVGVDGAIYYVHQGGSRIVRIAYSQGPSILTASLPNGTVSVTYNQTITATGGTQPYTWSVSNGALPAGLSLNATTGNISGTPTAQGTSTFTIQVQDANSLTNSRQFSITLAPQPVSLSIITSSLPSGTIGYAYNATLQAAGQNTVLPYTWSLQSGSLPTGLTFSNSGNDDVISGTPTESGIFNLTIRVQDSTATPNVATRDFTLTINKVQITTTSLTNATVGSAYFVDLSAGAANLPAQAVWEVTNGTLPPGMLLEAIGHFEGTPTQAGTYSFTIRVSETGNSLNSDSQAYTLTVNSVSVNSSSGSGGDSSAGGGCGFVKDDGKGQWPRGEGLALMLTLIISLAGIALIRRVTNLILSITLVLLLASHAHSAVEYGIAANYPGDAGIENAQGFVFRENFEEASISAMAGRWEDVVGENLMSFSPDKPSTSAGNQSVFFDGGAHLYRRFLPGYDQLYVRFYVKFDPVCSNIHHFVHMGGYNPTTRWPQGGAGIRPAGNERWTTGIEPNGTSWAWDFYSYWMHMRSNPDTRFWGNSYSGRPSPYTVNKNEWISVEFMVKMNNPVSAYNGEQAFWINGEKKVHLGQGFPRGEWIWDGFYPKSSCTPTTTCNQNGSPTPCCQDFEGFQWRNDSALNINFLWLLHYVDTDPSCTVKFDDAVVATQYIGPMVSSTSGDTGGNPPSNNSGGNQNTGGDSSASGGSGCGFVKDDGKGQKAKGEGLALMIMLIIVLLWIALIRRMFTIRIIQIIAVLLFSLAVGCGGGSAPADSIPADSVPTGDSGRVQSIEFITYGGAPVSSTVLNKIAFHRFDPTIIGGPDLSGNNDNTGTFELWIADPDGSNEGCISCGDVAGGPRRNQHKGAPTWHASGQWIVVAVEMPVHAAPHASAHAGLGAYLDLWAISPDGAQWYQLTYYANIVTTPRFPDTPAGALIPRFSRSGNKLVWAEMIGYDAQHPFAIWRLVLADFVVDATGPHLINHTRFEPGTLGTTFYEAWSFSPDDNYITVASESGGIHPGYMDVQIWNPNAGTLVNLTQTNDQYEEQAVFSPDGQWIAFMSTHGQSPPYDPSNDFWGTFRTDVWLMRADGTSSERLSYFSDPAHAEYLPGAVNRAVPVSWSPDGKSIYVNVDQNHGSQQTHETQRIYRINLR